MVFLMDGGWRRCAVGPLEIHVELDTFYMNALSGDGI